MSEWILGGAAVLLLAGYIATWISNYRRYR